MIWVEFLIPLSNSPVVRIQILFQGESKLSNKIDIGEDRLNVGPAEKVPRVDTNPFRLDVSLFSKSTMFSLSNVCQLTRGESNRKVTGPDS